MDVLAGLLGGPADEVAPRLLGAVLRHGDVAVRLTEVEAYRGEDDPASHAFRGRTARNGVMFGPAGRLYVYRSHGLHWCANVVTGPTGTATAVLLRAGEVVDGVDLARERRGPDVPLPRLARGPGNLCRALGVSGSSDGASLLGDEPLRLAVLSAPAGAVSTGPRVGVSRARDVAWRFWLTGEPSVSAYRRAPARE